MDSSRRPRGRIPQTSDGFSTSSPSEAPSRQSSRPPMRSRNSEVTETSIPRAQFPSTPLKGILKNSSIRPHPDPLAARFYRIPRPIRANHVSPSSIQSPYLSDSTHGSFDHETDSQSASSELSVNTQATSVDSDSVITKRIRPPKPTKPSTLVKHVRHVQPGTHSGTRPKVRPKPKPSTEVVKSIVPSGKRTVHIEVLPRQETPSSQEMQLVRRPDQSLVCKIEQLESDKQKLRQVQDHLHRELDDASEELSSKVRQNKEIGKALTQERNSKELIVQDLREQRRLFDIYRQDFELQQRILDEAERERDKLKQTRDDFEKQLIRLEDELSRRESEQKASEDMLRSQINKFEIATATLEKRINSRDREVEDLVMECDSLINSSKKYQAEIEIVREEGQEMTRKARAAYEAEKGDFQAYMKEAEGEKANLRAQVQGLEVEVDALKAHIADLKPAKQALEKELESEKASKVELQDRLHFLESEKMDLQKQIEAEKTAKEDIERQLQTSKEQFDKDLESVKEQFGKDLETVKDESERQLMASKEDFERQLREVKHDYREKLDDTNFKLQIEVEAKGDLAYQLSLAKKELDNQAEAFRTERSEKQARIDGLVTEIAGSNEANVSLASQRLQLNNELSQVRVNLASVQTDFHELQDRYKSLAIDNDYQRSKAAELDQKTEDLNNLRKAYASLEARVGNLRADIDDHHAAHKSLLVENEKLRAAHQALREEHDKVTAHARGLEDSSGYSRLSAEKFALETQLDEQEAKVTALSQEKAGLEARAAVLQAEAEKVAALTREKAELEARRGELEGEAEKVPSLTAQNQTLVAQLLAVNQQLEIANAAHSAASAQVRELQATVGWLQSQSQSQNQNQGRPTSRSNSRSKSRSKSRAPGSKHHNRSPSSSLIFVRSPADKSGVYITTKEALKSGE
ncbi:hypothetical protein F4809DRAFT_56331 [Biscogniauxia mediterranea]|nr:hypothetical protein F4809DRAFT_56331 [Biscogniauxia mediterranea]